METIKGKIAWHHVKNPSKRDLDWLKKEFDLHPVILEELGEPSARTHAEMLDGTIFLVYQFPIYDAKEKVSRRAEIDFLIRKNSVATIAYENLEALEEFKKMLKKDDFRGRTMESSLKLLYHIIEQCLNFGLRELNHIQEKIEAVSGELFHDKEKKILRQISYLKRDISEYRIIIRSEEHVLRSLLDIGVEYWGSGSKTYLNDLIGDYNKVVNRIEDYREAVSDFEDTNNQLMNVKMNEIMRTFTILAFITFPFMLFAALFSMNTKDTPLVDRPEAFWIILGMMMVGMISLITYFKKRDWL